ncbi:MAG: hypothetical protein WBF87_15010 [Mesorhizobium sp.]
MQKKHPQEFGFGLGIRLVAGGRAATSIDLITPAAKLSQSVVYVAILPDGRALKVGIASRGLWSRWKGIIGVMKLPADTRYLEPHEVRHGDSLNKFASGSVVEVWFKPAEMISLSYTKGWPLAKFCAAAAEEEFLDSYYQPLFGRALSTRDHFPIEQT